METQEKWVRIIKYKDYNFDGKYEVSNWGNIRNVNTKRKLCTYSNQRGQGYLRTKIVDENGNRRALYIHHLVAYYFLNLEQPKGTEIDHIDGNAKNNSFTNLRYVTHIENMKFKSEKVDELVKQILNEKPCKLGELVTKLKIGRTRIETIIDRNKDIYEDDDGKLKLKIV